MAEAAKWEYKVSGTEDLDEVQSMTTAWAEAGWELVNGSTSYYRRSSGSQFTWILVYTFFWRRLRQ